MDYRKLADQSFDQYLNDLNTLVSIPSVRDKEHASEGAPFGDGVKNALEALLEMGKRDGFEVKNYDGYAGTITIHDAGEGAERIGVLGHLDVVPAGDGWTRKPYGLTEEEGYLFGRGVLDDKGPLLAAYYAMKLLKENNVPLNKTVYLIAGTDEESGMEGIDYYIHKAHGPIPTAGFTPDADFPVIYGEKGIMRIKLESQAESIVKWMEAGTRPNVVIQHAHAILDTREFNQEMFDFYLKTNGLTGSASVEEDGVHLNMTGHPAHGASPYLGNNAGVHMLNFIGEAYGDKLCQAYYSILKDWKGTPLHIAINGVYMGFLTMNAGIIRFEDGKSDVTLDIRYPNDTDPEKIEEGILSALNGLDVPVSMTVETSEKPLFVDPNSKLVKDLMASYAKYTGDTFRPAVTIGGGTYAKHFDNFVAFGPEKSWSQPPRELRVGTIHSADEGVAASDLAEAIAIYADAIERLAS